MRKLQSNILELYPKRFLILKMRRSESLSKVINDFLIIIFPFATFFGAYIKFEGIGISYLYSMLLLISIFFSLLKNRWKYAKTFVLYFLIMIIYAGVSLLWSGYADIGVTIIFSLSTCFLSMCFIAALDEEDLKLFLNSVTFFTCIVLIMAVVEIVTGVYLFYDNPEFIDRLNMYGVHYPGVAFTNPNDLAQYLIIGLPLFIFSRIEKGRYISVAVWSAIGLFVLVNTHSRMSILSISAVVVFYLLLSFSKKINLAKLTIVIVPLIIIFSIGLLWTENILNYSLVNDYLKVDTSQSYFSLRADIYLKLFEVAMENPLGAGLGTSYAVSEVGPHNMFLFVFADLGFGVVAGFIFILVLAFARLYKLREIVICDYKINKIVIALIPIFPIFSSISSGNEQRKAVWLFVGLMIVTIKNSYKVYRSK